MVGSDVPAKQNELRVGFAQTCPEFGDVPGNLERGRALLDSAPAFDVLVLPELFATGYVFRDRAELQSLAEDATGPTLQFLRENARERSAWLAGGFAERDGARVFNSAALVGPEGQVHIYRKIHRFDRETEVFDPGDGPFQCHELAIREVRVRVGMLICFDWFFPESARCLALAGADVLLHPSNLVMSHCQRAMVTRCLENGVFAVTANRVGSDDRGDVAATFTGASQITGPGGAILESAPATGECVRVTTIDVEDARKKRISPRNDRLADRRPEHYGLLTKENADPGAAPRGM
ncbi:MAG: apolipoprotein N-acyltransferase [Gemmatimonadota bacterium]|nr:MAG: apolipoprotein N-acyltransferase [Gemmatimonadota bacterium]